MELKDKVAIITGSKQGIGLGIAKAFAKEGCKVVINSRDSEGCGKAVEEIRSLGAEAISVVCDVSIKEEVDNMINKTVENFGKLDILVNNAGIFPYKAFEQMSEEDWDKVLDVNLKGTFLCSQAAVEVMQPGSKIVNISSIASMIGFEQLVHYCASKGGMNGFTRALALELAPKKINVNGIAPGAVETPGVIDNMTEELKQQTEQSIPWKRMGVPEDIAHAAVFLASSKSDYIIGQTIVIDGGWTLR